MIHLQGKTICSGVVSGTAFVFKRNVTDKAGHKSVNANEEADRLELAISEVKNELIDCAEHSESETAKEIFEIHRMMLEDEDVLDYLRNAVQIECNTANDAVTQTEKCFSQMFLDTQDEYMIARIDDIKDVCGRLISHLTKEKILNIPDCPFVLVADELFPGDLMGLNRKNLKGIVLGSGSVYSHIAILIKEMGIPAMICGNINEVKNGMTVIMNTDNRSVYFEPDKKTVDDFIKTQQLSAEKNKHSPFSKIPCKLYVNIGNPKEVSSELMKKCDGIGLFRTEYLYLNRTDLPSEEEQFSVYKKMLETANGKTVTIRTFDIGSDKKSETIPLKNEENPALGLRGLRVYSLYPEIFKIQIRALLRAAVYGNLRIMYPMVTLCKEIDKIKEFVSQTAQELSEQGTAYKIPLQGAMIETPASALLSHKLAKTADFFSVGTNDLTQYTLAFDRQSEELDALDDDSAEAVMLLIKTAAENAHKNGIEIGICGELASQAEFIEKWIETDIDYLSVSPYIL